MINATSVTAKCPLCGRRLEEPCNKHHLLPLSEGGKGTVTVVLHKVCHDKIHSLFTEKQIAKEFNSIETLLTNEDIKKFVVWVRKKPDNYYDKSLKVKNL